ncbi:hypothetical protein [Phenylobacterium immobile]|uniref:hypothetical protein n=1 Tax=Phenylobacterium immobile TaxID=21 RepID=UPI000B07DFCD|nr:hypothetical protein [Phenylobacterium immobile]
MFATPLKRLFALGALAVAVTLASCASEPPPAPPPPPIPSVGLSPQIIEMAGAYRAYMNRATGISPTFSNGDQIAGSVRAGASYEPQQFLRGAIAYGAIVALQDPNFVSGVRVYAQDATQRRTIAYEILRNPAYAAGITGANSAAGLVIAALGADGRALLDQGKAVKQSAYDVQRQSWSKADVAGRDARLALAKQLSATGGSADSMELNRLSLAVNGAAISPLGITGEPKDAPYSPLVVRSLAVAALAALGYANDDSLAAVVPLMTDPASATCFNMSKLNLYQCLAVSKPHYEDVFCLGQHVMIDTGQCVMKAAGVLVPVEVRPAPLPVKAVTTKAKPKKAPAKKKS